MGTRPERPRRLGRVLGLTLLVLVAAPASSAWAADDEGEPPGQLRVIRAGAATLLVDEVGNAILYEDPTPPAEVCAQLRACWQAEVEPGASVDIGGSGSIRAIDPASGQVVEDNAALP